ncbi:putative sterigmatocystin biosynthesis monooxygenase stcW [Madurella mycetomatis]|uniref:Sterigmatocystin biosynthesis monooxygenase stcW n=1 Tax=Madurella mycetomatis TaxID=100816 RepID=A0A175W5T8_9PEZI|nr:putative sterigmatocystin biosynthesis monooxygenase stcW [Madurella mycetomatis]
MATVNGHSNGHCNGYSNGYSNGYFNEHVGVNFTLKDVPVENLRPLRVVVVGAGFSGILAAIRIPEKLRNVELVVYEKSERVGGVWWLNKYPGMCRNTGVACDIPSHSYQYTFAPNPNWSNLYAPGSEIQQYLEGVAERFGATRFIKTSHKVEHCEWDDTQKRWKIKVRNLSTGEMVEDAANVLVTARGQLNDMSWPDIPGLNEFQEKIMHSGDWDTTYDFRNKKIGIIGNGSSAIQIIPSLQKVEGASLTCFMRSPTWISSAFGDAGMTELGLDPTDTAFSEEQRRALVEDPAKLLAFRKVFESGGNLIQDSTILGTEMQKAWQSHFHKAMHDKLQTRPDLLALLIPSFAPGCRRLTPGKGFLESLLAPNVSVVSSPIQRITPSGVDVTAATPPTTATTATAAAASSSSSSSSSSSPPEPGTSIPLDVLICATGYNVSSPPPFPIVGRAGLPLAARWSAHPETYLSLAVDSFPNMLMMFGPNSAIGFGSLTKMFEAVADYIVACIRKLQKEDYAAMEPKPERVRDFRAYADAYFARTVYVDACRSWYRRGDKVVGLWPGSTLHALETLRAPRWEDWNYESVDGGEGNRLRWLGDGTSVTQTDGDPSWYINPDEVEVPVEGTPEKNPRYKARPWSY